MTGFSDQRRMSPSDTPRKMSECAPELRAILLNAFQAVLGNFGTPTDDGRRTTPDGTQIGNLRGFITSGSELLLTIREIGRRIGGSGAHAIELYAKEATAALKERKEDFPPAELVPCRALLQTFNFKGTKYEAACAALLREIETVLETKPKAS